MNVISFAVMVVLAIAVFALASGREKLKQYQAESDRAIMTRENGYGLGLVGAGVIFYMFLVVALGEESHWLTPWMHAVGYLGASVVIFLEFYWWKEWNATLNECEDNRAERRHQNQQHRLP